MKSTIVFLLFVLFLALTGCNKNKDLIVGCWSTLENYGQNQVANSYQFNDDNTWRYYTPTGPHYAGDNEGIYKIRRNKLILESSTSTTEYHIKKLSENEMIWEGSSTLYKCD